MSKLAKSLMMGAAGAAGAAGDKLYIEDVFSTYLYTGNGSTQTITNGIDLAGEGGMVWIKKRSGATETSNLLTRDGNNYLFSNQAIAEQSGAGIVYNSTGFGLTWGWTTINESTNTYASWTFRKAEKFFDVVTYTGNGTNQTIAHNLGSTPGFIVVKRTDNVSMWTCYHRSLTSSQYLTLNDTSQVITSFNAYPWNNTAPTATHFSVGYKGTGSTDYETNTNGATYVAYLFAHDAGGFGDDGTESVIKCGSFIGSTAGTEVNLGWEPQWVLVKNISSAENWRLHDVMRGMSVNDSSTAGALLYPSLTAAEGDSRCPRPTPTGFISDSGLSTSHTFIYIAIRRGPMKTPTDATTVFKDLLRTGTGSTTKTAATITPDFAIINYLPGSGDQHYFHDRLRGQTYLSTPSLNADVPTSSALPKFDVMGGIELQGAQFNSNGQSMIDWYFKRAPGFFDIVAYTGTGVARTVSHNLGVAPELMIVKSRSNSYAWDVYSSPTGAGNYLTLHSSSAPVANSSVWNDTNPTATVFTVGTIPAVNASGSNFIAYLFATCPGVSKVGGFTGTGTTLNVDCGFASGARFLLIKRTDTPANWYVFDTARGFGVGNDAFLTLDTTDANNTSNNFFNALNAGFQIIGDGGGSFNVNGASYIFLAIA